MTLVYMYTIAHRFNLHRCSSDIHLSLSVINHQVTSLQSEGDKAGPELGSKLALAPILFAKDTKEP